MLVDEHLDDLYVAACLMLGKRDEADVATAEAFDDVWTTSATPPGKVTKREIIHHLYVRCINRTDAHSHAHGLGGRRRTASAPGAHPSSRRAEIQRLSRQQRSAIALALCGELTHRQIADVLSLSVPAVADLMRSALLAIADDVPTD